MLFLKIPMSNYRTKASFLHRIFFIIQSMLQQHCFLLQKGGIFFSTIQDTFTSFYLNKMQNFFQLGMFYRFFHLKYSYQTDQIQNPKLCVCDSTGQWHRQSSNTHSSQDSIHCIMYDSIHNIIYGQEIYWGEKMRVDFILGDD